MLGLQKEISKKVSLFVKKKKQFRVLIIND